MKGDDEETLGGGLGAAIFLMPLIFGWLAFRRGYHPAVKAVVAIYMVLSTIPLYFLISLLWNSGDDVSRLARDYDKNRSAAERSAGKADSYIEQYEAGDLRPIGTDSNQEQSVRSEGPLSINARSLAQNIERDQSALANMTGKTIEISGDTMGPAQGARIYLVGDELYPAVILEYQGTTPEEGAVTATCTGIRMESAGPVLENCQ